MLGAMTDLPTPTIGPGIALETLLFTTLCGVLVMLGVLLVAGGPWLGYYTVHLWLPMWLIACEVFGAARLADRPPWLRKGVRLTRSQLVEYGGGFYGAVAVIAFIWLEWARLGALWAAFADGFRVQVLVRQIIDFGIDSIFNAMQALVWPAFHAKAFTMHDFWLAFGVSAAIYGAAEAVMSRLPARR